jgi:hypothetical protein
VLSSAISAANNATIMMLSLTAAVLVFATAGAIVRGHGRLRQAAYPR